MSEIRVFSPASVSNVTCGFDVLGFALEGLGDEVVVAESSTPGVQIKEIIGADLPLEPEKNTAGKAALSFLEKTGITTGIEITIYKNLPIGSGIGSSASSAAAAAYACNMLFDTPLDNDELLNVALDGEFVASGSYHGDNIAPALFGGFLLIRSLDPIDILSLDYPENLYCALLMPNQSVSTKEARGLLPKEYSLKTVVQQTANIASLVHALAHSDFDLLARSMKDYLAEPYRATLLPWYDSVCAAAKSEGAFGYGISGSGPAFFAFGDSQDHVNRLGKEMENALVKHGFTTNVYTSRVSETGAVEL